MPNDELEAMARYMTAQIQHQADDMLLFGSERAAVEARLANWPMPEPILWRPPNCPYPPVFLGYHHSPHVVVT